MRFAVPSLLLMLAACQSYAPAPLDSAPQALAPPNVAALSQAAESIDRPFLSSTRIDLAEPLDANAVAVLAVVANPDLKAARARAGIDDAQVFAARLMPDPTLSVGIGKVLSGPDVFLDLANALGLDLNALRTRGVQLARARAAADQVRLDLAWAEWQTAGAARVQAVRIVVLRRSLQLAQASATAANSLFERTRRAAGRGDVSADRLQTAQTAAADAEDKANAARRELAVAELELNRLIGLPPAFRLQLAPFVAEADPIDAAHLFLIAQLNRTDLKALQAGYASQEAAVRKAILDQFPTVGLTVNANRDTAGNFILGPAIDFTIPLWNRNRGGIAIEQATREALKAEYDARLFRTRAEIAATVAGIEVARRQKTAVLRDLPAARRFAETSRRAADHGDISKATAEIAEQAWRDRELLSAQAEQAIAEQMIALELLTGTLREAWTR